MATTSFVARGAEGLVLWEGPPGDIKPTSRIQEQYGGRVSAFSKDGKRIAWCNGREVVVVNLETNERECIIPRPKTTDLVFSPCASYLCTWEIFMTREGVPNRNVGVWALPSGEEVVTYSRKARTSWHPKWTEDEGVCVRHTQQGLLFFDGHNITGAPTHKLKLAGLYDFEVAPHHKHCRVAVWIRGKKGMPSAVRVYTPANLEVPVTYKTFFKADSVSINWSSKGMELLVSTQTDSDATGASYYGETHLYFLTCFDGTSANVPLDKKGPIGGCAWSPNGRQFVVLYGGMPNKAAVFNYKCKKVQDLGEGHRSMARYNPHGTVLALCGFGNLGGEVEIWDTEKWEMINKFVAFNTTTFEWCPDGRHILMATTRPRSTVDNCFKVWHYTKGEVMKKEFQELYEAKWQPMPARSFPKRPISPVPEKAKESLKTGGKPEPYRPPGMRNRVVGHAPAGPAEDEKKKKKKRRNRRRKGKAQQGKDDDADEEEEEVKGEVKGQQQQGGEAKAQEKPPKEEENKKPPKKEADKEKQAPPQDKQAIKAAEEKELPSDPEEKAKRARALKKKLRQIDQLKQKQAEGTQLNEEQLSKMSSAAALEVELKRLQLDA